MILIFIHLMVCPWEGSVLKALKAYSNRTEQFYQYKKNVFIQKVFSLDERSGVLMCFCLLGNVWAVSEEFLYSLHGSNADQNPQGEQRCLTLLLLKFSPKNVDSVF